jgi:hypothetical protein
VYGVHKQNGKRHKKASHLAVVRNRLRWIDKVY